MGRVADVDQIDFRVREQVVQALVLLNPSQIDHLARRAEVSADGAPVPRELGLIAAADCGELCALEVLVGKEVNPAHEADADEADADHDEFLNEADGTSCKRQNSS